MKICFVYNPQAGSAQNIGNILTYLDDRHRYELCPTSPQRPAETLAREASEDGSDRIVVLGGDGTLSSVVNGIAPRFSEIEIGLIPAGTGNDFARMLNFQADFFEEACRRAIHGKAKPIDVIRITDNHQKISYAINVANGGFSGRIAAHVKPEDKKSWGAMAYWITSVSNVVAMESYEVELIFEDQENQMVTDVICVSIANGRFVGGGFPIAPYAEVDDGLLDVTVIPNLPVIELMTSGLQHFTGRTDQDSRIMNFKTRSVRVKAEPDLPFSIDGEVASQMDVLFECLPGAVRFAGYAHTPPLKEMNQDTVK